MTTSAPSRYERFPDLVPKSWLGPSRPTVWLRAYHCLGASVDPTGVTTTYLYEAEQVCIVFRHTGFSYPRPIELAPAEGNQLAIQHPEMRELPTAVYLLLMTPHDEGEPNGEEKELEKLDVVGGMLACVLSPNVVYQRLFEHREPVEPGPAYISSVVRWPTAFRHPDLPADIARVRDAIHASTAAPEAVRRRLRFSLRWFLAGSHDFGADAFVKYWIAIESLTMSSEKTGPLIDLLASAYGKNKAWVLTCLKIDRLAQYRGRVVHAGDRSRVNGNVLRFLVALYEDVFAAKLGLAVPGRAEVLAKEGALKFV